MTTAVGGFECRGFSEVRVPGHKTGGPGRCPQSDQTGGRCLVLWQSHGVWANSLSSDVGRSLAPLGARRLYRYEISSGNPASTSAIS